MIKRKKINRLLSCWPALYYLCFTIWAYFPAAHSELYDLYQGRVTSLVVLEDFHYQPSDKPFAVLDDHSITIITIEKCLVCTTYTPCYFAVCVETGFLFNHVNSITLKDYESLHTKPDNSSYRLRAPPSQLS